MFRIGEFSKLGLVTVRTLRHYDEVGLLKPEQIDPFTGYRYYSVDQLSRLNRILALKDLGLSLEQIAQLLDNGLSREQMFGMLKLKEVELKQLITAEQERLLKVQGWLKQLERENVMTEANVVLKKVAPIKVLSVRDVTTNYQAASALFNEVYGHLARYQVTPTAPAIIVQYDEEYKERDVDQEVAVPIEADVPETDRLKVRVLPEFETAVSLMHYGAFENFTNTYSSLMQWVQANGYKITGPNREIYVDCDPAKDPSTFVVEIMFPVAKA